MRTLLATLLAAGLVAAAPAVRWIDNLGDARTEAVADVLVETGDRIKVKYPDGKEAVLPVTRLVWLVRERDDRKDEQALLGARLDVAAGLRPDEARTTLDRLLAGKREDWLREYAAAARTLLAERTGEKGALDRIGGFLERYLESRFRSEVLRARARLRAQSEQEPEKAMAYFVEAHEDITKAKGPFVSRYATFADSAAWIIMHLPDQAEFFMNGIEGRVRATLEEKEDLAMYTAAEAGIAWARLNFDAHLARECIAGGHPPRGQRSALRKYAKRSWLLAEARCDLLIELARLQQACEEPEQALASLAEARELAPDPRRREIAKALEARMGRGEHVLTPPDK